MMGQKSSRVKGVQEIRIWVEYMAETHDRLQALVLERAALLRTLAEAMNQHKEWQSVGPRIVKLNQLIAKLEKRHEHQLKEMPRLKGSHRKVATEG